MRLRRARRPRRVLKAYVADMRRQAAAAGRDPRKIFIYNLVTVIVDETDAKAQAKFEDYQQYASYDGSLVFMSGWSGIDFGQYAPTDLVTKVETNAIISVVEELSGGDRTSRGRSRNWRSGAASAASGPVFVGSPSTVADILQDWVEETDVDGFNLAYAVTPETFEDVVEHLVPELQKRGVYPQAYSPGHPAREAVRRWALSARDSSGGALSRHLGRQRRTAEAAAVTRMSPPILDVQRRVAVVPRHPGAYRSELRGGAGRDLRAHRTERRRQELAAQRHQRRLSGESGDNLRRRALRRPTPMAAAQLGIGRTFQHNALFKRLSVLDNVLAGLTRHGRATFSRCLPCRPARCRAPRRFAERADEIIAFLEIGAYRDAVVGACPTACRSASNSPALWSASPKLLLLDEPMAGMNADEKEEIGRLIREVNRDLGTTVVLIEHDIGIVMGLSHHVVVLDYGRKVGDGTPDEVRRQSRTSSPPISAPSIEDGAHVLSRTSWPPVCSPA